MSATLDSPSLFVPPSPDVAVVGRAMELRPLIGSHAEEGEAQRRVPEPVIAALKDAGLLHPKAISGAVFSPGTSAQRVDGGLLISDRWPYATGCLHADSGGIGVVLGEHDRDVHAREYTDELVARASFMPDAVVILCFAQLGAARGALDATLERMPEKPIAYSAFPHTKDSPAHQMAIAEAASMIDAAYLLAARACADIDRAAERGESVPMLIRARIRMDTGQIAQLCREAINKLLTVNGPSSFATGKAIQRFWRDSEVASSHALAEPEIAKLSPY